MSLCIGSDSQTSCRNWRLGPHDKPGWFDTSGSTGIPGRFVLATVFRLHWEVSAGISDGIYNLLHAVTMGRSGQRTKTHLEQLAQILCGNLHITCRIADSTGQTLRNTVALPGSWHQYQDRDLLLIYTGNVGLENPVVLDTMNVLYDYNNFDLLQCITYRAKIASITDVDFSSWPGNRVICDHEFDHMPMDHVMVHGHSHLHKEPYTPFALNRVWGSLDQTIDPLDISEVQSFAAEQMQDVVGTALAWYNCDFDRVIQQQRANWNLCTGRYRC